MTGPRQDKSVIAAQFPFPSLTTKDLMLLEVLALTVFATVGHRQASGTPLERLRACLPAQVTNGGRFRHHVCVAAFDLSTVCK